MAEQSDGSIVIDTELDNGGFDRDAGKLLSSVKEIKNSLTRIGAAAGRGLSSAIGAMRNFSQAAEEVKSPLSGKNFVDDAEAVEQAYTRLEKQTRRLSDDGALEKQMQKVNAQRKALQGYFDEAADVQERAAQLREYARSQAEVSAADQYEAETLDALYHKHEAEIEQYNRLVAEYNRLTDARNQAVWENALDEQFADTGDLEADINRATAAIEKFQEKVSKMNAIGATDRAWDSVEYDIGKASERLDEYAQKLADLNAAGQIRPDEYEALSASLEGAMKAMGRLKDSIPPVSAESDEAEKSLRRVDGELRQKPRDAGAAAKAFFGLGEAMKDMATRAMATLAGQAKQATIDSNALVKSLTSMKRLLLTRVKRMFISAIFNGVRDSLRSLAQFSSTFNAAMSSIRNSAKQLSGNLAVSIGGLVKTLEPMITGFINTLSTMIQYINRLFATLSGQSTMIVAKKQTDDYADSLNKTAGAAKKASKQLASFDEIQQLQDKSGGGSGSDATDLFEEVPLDALKNPFEDIFATFHRAWESEGRQTMDAIKNVWGEIKAAAESVGRSFREVFTNGTGQASLEMTLRIVQNIAGAAGGLADSFRRAWEENEVGTKIVQHLWDMLNDVLQMSERITQARKDWIAGLDFSPIMAAVENLTAKLEPLVRLISDGLAWGYQNVLLPLASWTIEAAAPALVDALAAAFDALRSVLELLKPPAEWIWTHFLEPLSKWVGDNVVAMIEAVTEALRRFTQVVDGLREVLAGDKPVSEWVQENFGTFADIISSAILFAQNPTIGMMHTLGVDSLLGFKEGAEEEGEKRSWLSTLFGGIVQYVMRLLGINSPSTVFAEIGKNIVLGLLQGLTDTWTRITQFFSTVLFNLKKSISDAWNSITTTARGAWNAISQLLTGIWSTLQQTAATVWNAVRDFFSTTWNSIKTTATTMWGNIKTTVTTKFNEAKATLTEGAEKLKTNLQTTWENIKTTAAEKWDAVKANVTTRFNTLKATVISTAGQLKTELGTKWDSLKEDTTDAWDSLKEDVTDLWGELKDNLASVDWTDIGENLVEGIKSGITGMWRSLTSTVSRLANQLTSAAMRAFDEHSPSKKWAEIGEYLDLGLQQGLEDEKRTLLSTVSNIASDMSDAISGSSLTVDGASMTAGIDSVLTTFSDKVTDSLYALTDRLQAIADNVTFRVPEISSGAFPPYRVAAAANAAPAEYGAQQNGGGDRDYTDVLREILQAIRSGKVLAVDRNVFASLIYETNRSETIRHGGSLIPIRQQGW